jgi:hypothetical protein
MPQHGARRSTRIKEQIPITVIGSDTEGRVFLEQTHTLLISLHGAGVASQYKLSPEQEVVIRLPDSNKEADVRVIGQMGQHGDLYVYGVAFLQSHINFWDREFTALTEPDKLTLECGRCKSLESVEHSDLEVDVYTFNQNVVRYCKECRSSTVWRKSSEQLNEQVAFHEPERRPATAEAQPDPPTARDHPEHKRKHHRAKAKFRACIRRHGFEDDIVVCEDVSRGGVCFKSRRSYCVDTMIEIAVPYSPGTSSIFSPAQILYVQELDPQKYFRCGAAYTESES